MLKGSCLVLTLSGLLAAQKQTPQTTTKKIKGGSTSTTEKLHGTVAYVEGNTLVVKMASGNVPNVHAARIPKIHHRRQGAVCA